MATIIDRCFNTTAYVCGGSFEKGLLDLWYKADNGNRRKLEDAFPEYFPIEQMELGTGDRTHFMDIPCYDYWKEELEDYREVRRLAQELKRRGCIYVVEDYWKSFRKECERIGINAQPGEFDPDAPAYWFYIGH